MKHLLSLLFLFCNLLPGFTQNKPNIILIVADDLGYGDLSSYGQQKFSTPNIDRLAAEGMRFTQFYSGTSVCAPSRSALMSGQHTGHTYIRGNKEMPAEGQEPITASMRTIAEELKDAGYVTGAFGKWGLGFVGTEGDPLNQGFDRFYGYNCQRESHRYYPDHLWDDDRKVMLEGNGGREKKTTFAPDLIQQQALAFMEQHKKEPFFLFLPYVLPHAELDGPEDSLFLKFKTRFPEREYKGNDYGPGASVAGYASQAYPRAMFASMMSRLDKYVGQVMDKLRQLGLDQNTLVIFTSDNGPHKEGGGDPAFFNGSGGLRGTKRDLYEGGIRVPMLARWPTAIRPGQTNNLAAAFWDLYPTLAAVAGAKHPVATDGVSIMPSLTSKGRQEKHHYFYWEFHESGGVQAVRMGKWKAVKRNVKKGDSPLELYDLSADPAETNDLAAGNPKLVKRLQEIMNTAHVESTVFPLNPVK